MMRLILILFIMLALSESTAISQEVQSAQQVEIKLDLVEYHPNGFHRKRRNAPCQFSDLITGRSISDGPLNGKSFSIIVSREWRPARGIIHRLTITYWSTPLTPFQVKYPNEPIVVYAEEIKNIEYYPDL